ncbi:MAG: T9SS type A sorting domain-containing protein, partial [Bacteroidota bacterium]
VTITVNDVCTFTGVCISEDGNTATFSSNKSTLTEVFVYPNPVRNHGAFEGVRFANLTQQAIIKVYTVSGKYVIALEETDGDGGLQWNLRDVGNNRISPGIYLYHVSTNQEGIEEFVGKFTVVE